MQFVNDDMDELFRQAAEQYPLNTNCADWNKVQQQLHSSSKAQTPKSKRDNRLLWLLLLLPIGFVCGRYVGKNESSFSQQVIPSATKVHQKQQSADRSKSEWQSSFQKVATGMKKAEENVRYSNASTPSGENKPDSTVAFSATNNSAKHLIFSGNKKTKKKSVFITAVAVPAAPNHRSTKTATQSNLIRSSGNETVTSSIYPLPVAIFRSTPNTTIINNPISGDSIRFSQAALKNKVDNKQTKTFYYSFVAGPDITSIELKHVKQVGYSAGVWVGYRFNKKWALETGVLFDRKKYYVEGEYWDSTKLHLPMHSSTSYGQGDCFMVELPLNVRFQFTTGATYQWSASLGTSSYFMEREEYKVTYKRYNQSYEQSYNYGTASKDWFSVWNISVGLQKTLGSYSSVRVEPYMKLPIKGLGEQDLHIISTGLHLVVSYVIH